MFATGAASASLLALLIGLQNLPEGFNAYRELDSRTPAPDGATKCYLYLRTRNPALAFHPAYN